MGAECGVGWTVTDHITGDDIDCVDTSGSYFCVCPPGYYTADNNHAIHQGSIDGTYPPVTGQKAPGGNPAGNNTEYDKKCYDIDECAWNVCNGEHQLCYNKNGSYDCLCEW